MMAGNCGNGLPAAVEALAGARTDDAVFVVGPDHRVVYWDPRTEFLTGLAGAEVVGKPLHETVAGEREDGTPFCHCGCSAMRLARAGQSVPSHEVRLCSPTGKKRWVSVTVLNVDAEEGPYLINLLRDSQRMHDALEMARALVRGSNGDAFDTAGNTPELTSRQLEVLRLLSEGMSARAVGRELGIAEATVRGHVRGLLRAFGMHSQIEVLAEARKTGLLAG
ncbi:PAS domain-containing protein [Rubrobacter tropicus]|uniref:PAS domain-containing protein n=1 Tax=Rubrobacter tropicus TaxID=2653851 RepID=A0A6G8QDL3_9ACTN|nr:LuxR C-terminal-related transcriptional regulator [Rubrobacter tropicus]QIN84569.1 PAS domain-containing protein [Rubrobacter tropicus]